VRSQLRRDPVELGVVERLDLVRRQDLVQDPSAALAHDGARDRHTSDTETNESSSG
jgi:hypothetical protein